MLNHRHYDPTQHRIFRAMSNCLRKPQRRFSIIECFAVCRFDCFSLFASCFLKHPGALPLASVDFFFWIFGKDGFVLVDLTRGFSIFSPIYDPVLEGWGMVVEMVMADSGYLGFVGCFCYVFSKSTNSLEFEGMRRQTKTVGRQRDSSIQQNRNIGRFHKRTHRADTEAFRCQRCYLN